MSLRALRPAVDGDEERLGLIGDPETGELELVCQDCIAPEERAMFNEHHQRLAKYAIQRYATPSWKIGPHPTSSR